MAWELPKWTEAETKELESKGLIHRMDSTAEGPWPASTIFAVVDLNPAQAVGVFSDYTNHKNFVPKIIRSDIVQSWDNGVKSNVSFTLDMPIMSDSEFTMEDIIEDLGQGAYQIKWQQVVSDASLKSDGHARFYPIEGGKSIFEYHCLVVPKSALAVVLEKLAVKEARNAFSAIVTQLAKTAKEGGPYLQQRTDFIRNLFQKAPAVSTTK